MSARSAERRGARGRRGFLLATTSTLLLLAGCRDATEPPGIDTFEKVSSELPRRLTYSLGNDRSPAWSADGRFVYYTTPGLPPFAETDGLLLRVPVSGGDARAALPGVQFPSGIDRWLVAPVMSPDGARLAYVEMWTVRGTDLCPGSVAIQCTPAGASPVAPRLGEVFFRVREPGSPTAVEGDPFVRVSFEGLTPVTPPPGSGVGQAYEVTMYPFHQLYNQERSFIFRPSWSPDGQRIVLSDGLRLLIWDVGTGQLSPIPGTEDGVYPAWSPDGEWIAFTTLERGGAVEAACTHFSTLGAACQQVRTVYPLEGMRLTLIRPDGSERTELADGGEPAWTPDSHRLVYRNDGQLAVISASGGEPSLLSDVDRAREPAVSPDGTLVAYAMIGDNGSYDIWVSPLNPEAQ